MIATGLHNPGAEYFGTEPSAAALMDPAIDHVGLKWIRPFPRKAGIQRRVCKLHTAKLHTAKPTGPRFRGDERWRTESAFTVASLFAFVSLRTAAIVPAHFSPPP